jgi:DnaJ-class molecular chaperone
MDHYSTLGVDRGASPDDIKRAYRKAAAQHHPDRGGDTAKFQEVQAAYETLSDPGKRQQYDNPQPQGFPGGFHFNMGGVPPGFEDIFNAFGGSPFGDMFGGRRQQPQRNKTLNMQTSISLEDAFSGKDLMTTVVLPSGREQLIDIKIPAGINDGTTLRLSSLGDDTIPNIPRGDIHLTVHVHPHHKFQRQGDDLVMSLDVSCIDAMLGKTINVETIDKRMLEITVKPGTQPGSTLAAVGYGMPNVNDNRFKGRMLIQINITIPTITDYQADIIRSLFP